MHLLLFIFLKRWLFNQKNFSPAGTYAEAYLLILFGPR